MNFDKIINRQNTQSYKFDNCEQVFGTTNLLPMWVADMDFEAPPCVLEALTQKLQHGVLGYNLNAPYYSSVINWHQRRHGFTFEPENLFFTPGVVPAIKYLIQAFTQPGDKIIVHPPVYYPFFGAIRTNNRELVYNQLIEQNNCYYFDFDDLKAKAKDAKMLILSNPHNPGGRVWEQHELLQLAQICIENNLLVIADEIHCDMLFESHKHVTFATLNPEIAARTITTHSPSKTFNLAGLATAYIIITHPQLQKQYKQFIEALQADTVNHLGLIAMQAAYTHGEPWLNQLMQYIQNNVTYVNTYLNQNIPLITPMQQNATYLVWLNCKNLGLPFNNICEFMIKKAKLGLNNGNMFGPGGEGYQRINVGCPHAVVNEALNRLKNAVELL